MSLEVNLSLAGSFEAKTIKISGKVQSTKTGYSAEKLIVQIDDLTTGIDLRDDHLRKYLKGGGKLTSIILTKVIASNNLGTGTLGINGVEKAISFSYKKISENKLEANLKLKSSDFKLPEVNYMGVGVDDEVTLKVILDV